MSDWHYPEFRDEPYYGEKFGPVYQPPAVIASLAIGTKVCKGRRNTHELELILYDNGCLFVHGEPNAQCEKQCRINPRGCLWQRRRIDPAEAERIIEGLRKEIGDFAGKIPRP